MLTINLERIASFWAKKTIVSNLPALLKVASDPTEKIPRTKTTGNAEANCNLGVDVLGLARAMNQKAALTHSHHFCDPTLAFSDPVYQQLLSLWRGKAGTRAMPARSEILPRDVKNYMGHLIICQRVAKNPSRYLWRLIGTKVAKVVGHNTGKMFEECAPPELSARWIECCDLILEGGQPLRFFGHVHINGSEYLDAENFYVPLANDEGLPTFVMGLCRYTPRFIDNEEIWSKQIGRIPNDFLSTIPSIATA